MFKKLSLAKKLSLGFGGILFGLLVIATIAYFALEKTSEGFVGYQEMSRDAVLASDIRSGMLMVRMKAKDFILSGSKEDEAAMLQDLETAKQRVEEGKASFSNPQRLQLIREIHGEIRQYGETFAMVTDLVAKRNELMTATLNLVGPKMEKTLTEIMDVARKNGQTQVAVESGLAMRHLLLGRLYLMKFLEANNQQDADRLRMEFSAFAERLGLINSFAADDRTVKLLATADQLRSDYLTAFERLVHVIQERNDLIVNSLDRIGPRIAQKTVEVEQSVEANLAALGEEQRAANQAAANQILAVGLGILVFGILVATLMTRAITVPILRSVDLANAIAKGDFANRLNIERGDEIGKLAHALDFMSENLTEKAELARQISEGDMRVEVPMASEKDILGRALRTMVTNLSRVLADVQSAAEQIASGSTQVSDSSQSLSQGATEQASSLEEISSSMGEITSQVEKNAENAGMAEKVSGKARQVAEEGNRKMREMVTAIGEINDAGQNISKIIKVIDEIAFQTNLLALNAAVEAARAGAHGKGFAVVAEEVRNLAARSAKAAKETEDLIATSVQKAEGGNQIAAETESALEEIVASIVKASDLVAEIAAASSEQSQGIAQINQGLSQIDQVTQSNTASAEEGAAAAEELSGQAEHLRGLLTQFQLNNPASSGNLKSPQKALAEPESWAQGTPTEQRQSFSVDVVGNQDQAVLGDAEFGRY